MTEAVIFVAAMLTLAIAILARSMASCGTRSRNRSRNPIVGIAPLTMFAPNPHRPLGQTLILGVVVIGTAALGAAVLWAATGWLWLVVHQGLH